MTGEVLFDNIGAEFTSGSSRTEGPFCLAGCGCWKALSGGGSFQNEVSWSLEVDGETIAEVPKVGNFAKFCGGVCSTSCGVGEQPNAYDIGSCELCPKDSYSDTTGGELCSA